MLYTEPAKVVNEAFFGTIEGGLPIADL